MDGEELGPGHPSPGAAGRKVRFRAEPLAVEGLGQRMGQETEQDWLCLGTLSHAHLPSHAWPDLIIGGPKDTLSIIIYLHQ